MGVMIMLQVIADEHLRLKLSYKGKKTNILKEKLKVTYSVVLVLAFLSAENEN